MWQAGEGGAGDGSACLFSSLAAHTRMAGYIVGLKFRGLQRGLKDGCIVSQLTGCVGEGRLRDSILGAQVVIEGGPVWAVEVFRQVIRARAILIAWPEVDSCFPLCLNPSHIAQLSIDLCWGKENGLRLAPAS